jgi:two-component system, LytTR family, sensor kinase
MKQFDFEDKIPSFWTIQLIGWILYFAVIYITFLSIAAPEMFLNLFYLKGFRALTGFFLTSIFLRPIYRRFGNQLSIFKLVFLVLICAVVLGSAWTAIEAAYNYLTGATFNMPNYLARSPRITLDYSMTLMAWSASYLGIKNWLAWQKERENALQANFLADKAQLEVLRYQLNPHFLFNALNSIRASVDEDKNRAKQMITQLAEFLRHTLVSGEKKEIPLFEEIDAVKNYLAIEKIRFEDKLEIEYDIDEKAKDVSVPCLLINPLVENAIKHGLQTSPKPLRIKISAKFNDGKLILEVGNTGRLDELIDSNGTKIGLKNVRERLEKLFPERSSFELKQDDEVVVARIEIKF